MRRMLRLVLAALVLMSTTMQAQMPSLTDAEKKQGWKLLFDGKSLAGWRAYKSETPPTGWRAENGELSRVGPGGGQTVFHLHWHLLGGASLPGFE